MRSVLIVSVLMVCVRTWGAGIVSIKIVSVLIISQLIVRAGMVSMLTIGGGVGPATGPNENGAPADKFFSRKFPALPNLALAPNDPKFADADGWSCSH